MHITQNPIRFISRSAAIITFAAAATLSLQAQRSKGIDETHGAYSQPLFSATTLLAANETPATIGYSSSAGAEETASAESYISSSLAADPSPQPPPRRYGRRPVYADSHHNADGSNKYAFFIGGGFVLPTGGTHNYLSTGYAIHGGAGRNFNKKLALLAEVDYDHANIQTNTLNNLLVTYVNLGATGQDGSALGQLGGTNHNLSIAAEPMYTYMDHDKLGGYVIGGVGFYHKVTDFTTPAVGQYCDYYYGCYSYEANQTIDSYVSNAVGYNGGLGFTYKGSRFSDLKFYAEARYVYTANSRRPYFDGAPGTTNPTASVNYFNVFPQNSAPTTFIPVTFGIRF